MADVADIDTSSSSSSDTHDDARSDPSYETATSSPHPYNYRSPDYESEGFSPSGFPREDSTSRNSSESATPDISQEVDTQTSSSDRYGSGEAPIEQSEEDLERAADVEEALRDVVDPELGINIVDLGLIYGIWIDEGNIARVNMTLTSPACPLTDILEEQAQDAVIGGGFASGLDIRWVWMPPWGPHMITDDGRDQLRALGFSI